MKHLKRPEFWFLVALLLVTAVGALLLAQTGATQPEARHLSYSRHAWQATFDALSAACGVGLLTYNFHEDYTPLGRWILTAIGVVGAMLFLAAAAHAARRARMNAPEARTPHPLAVVGAFLAMALLVLGIVVLVQRICGPATDAAETAWDAIAAFSSLGWAGEARGASAAPALPFWSLSLLAWLGALGGSVWLLAPWPFKRRAVRTDVHHPVPATPPPAGRMPTPRHARARPALVAAGTYTATLLLAALLISAFESPRGSDSGWRPVSAGNVDSRSEPGRPAAAQAPTDGTLSERPWPARYARSLVQVAAASGAGVPTESLAEHDVSPGTKVTLSTLLLIGGLSGSATGGVQWMFLLWALAGGVAALGGSGGLRRFPDAARWMHAGLACCFLLTLLAVIVASGLLLIENWTAARYQPPPTFADALLDACSVVGGGDLTSGLTEAVTGRNLHSGIGQSASLYQYGMSWLMLAMLVGRMLPLVVLSRLSAPRPGAADIKSPASPNR